MADKDPEVLLDEKAVAKRIEDAAQRLAPLITDDSVLVCLGHKELSGAITNARLAVRKNRGGPQGQEYPFSLRLVEMGQDEDGEPGEAIQRDLDPGKGDRGPTH